MKIRIVGSNVQLQPATHEDLIKRKIEASDNHSDFLYLKGRILTCDEPNANGDYFPEKEVEASYETFIGGIVDFNHNQEILLGRIIDAVFIKGALIQGSDKREHSSVDIICKINKKAYPEHTSNIEAGILCQMSLEAYADEAKCSICGHIFDFIQKQPCEHITGGLMRKLMCDDGVERQVWKEDMKLTFTGAGIVPNPADKNADIYTVIAKANEKVAEGKIDEAKQIVDTIKGEDTLKEALKKLNGLEFVSILQAVQNKSNGKTKTVATEIGRQIDIPITEKEFYDILSSKYGKLTTIEIDDIKKELRASKKLLGNEFNAHVVTSSESEPYWLITQNSMPKFKAFISQIWGDELKKNTNIDGIPLKEYAVSDIFRKRLLCAIEAEGIDYVTETWGIEGAEEEPVDFLTEVKALAKELGIEIKAEDVASYVFADKKIKASTTWFLKNQFSECVNKSQDKEDITLKAGQSKADAVESFCFNSVMSAGKITASKKELNIWATIYNVLGGNFAESSQKAGKDVCAWLGYKVSGKWYKNNETSKKLLAKSFVIKSMGKLNRFNDTKDYLINLGFDTKFVENFGVYASKQDVDSMFNVGFNINDIQKLLLLRFAGDK